MKGDEGELYTSGSEWVQRSDWFAQNGSDSAPPALVKDESPPQREVQPPGRFEIHPFGWRDALRVLQGEWICARPANFTASACTREHVFHEKPVQRRRKGDDKWLTSGGQKGSTEMWMPGGRTGVLKRYGRVVPAVGDSDLSVLKFAQYTMLTAPGHPVRAKVAGSCVWVVQPAECANAVSPESRATFAPSRDVPSGSTQHAAIDVCASSKFISFQSSLSGEEGLELGTVMRKDEAGGVTLQSTQGDFAEWYRLAEGQRPLEEGDVVGFRTGGTISQNTSGCAMLGVVSRKAVVEGSAPPPSKSHLYDTVAICGVVPVKLALDVRRLDGTCQCPVPQTGQLLTPSGRHDGTAVLVPAIDSVPRVGMLLDESGVESALAESHKKSAAAETHNGIGIRNDGPRYVFATALVVTPTQTVPRTTSTWIRQFRKMLFAILWLSVSLVLAVVALARPQHSDANDSLAQQGMGIVALHWGPPPLANVTALCPTEVEYCLKSACATGSGCAVEVKRTLQAGKEPAYLGENSCPRQLSHMLGASALPYYKHSGGAIIGEPMLAIFGCYFSHYPPPGIVWQGGPANATGADVTPASVDTFEFLISNCGVLVQKLIDQGEDGRAELDAALESNNPIGGENLMKALGCYFLSPHYRHHTESAMLR